MSTAMVARLFLLATLSVCASAVHPIVLCSGLNQSLANVMALEINNHVFPQSLTEEHCVSIDPCTELSSNGVLVPPRVWTWANSSALHIAPPEQPEHVNFYNLEFARVPAGVKLSACQPDFAKLREGVVECNANTITTVSGACPSLAPFTLLDCISSIQSERISLELPFRSQNEIMHFGSRTYNDANDEPVHERDQRNFAYKETESNCLFKQ